MFSLEGFHAVLGPNDEFFPPTRWGRMFSLAGFHAVIGVNGGTLGELTRRSDAAGDSRGSYVA